MCGFWGGIGIGVSIDDDDDDRCDTLLLNKYTRTKQLCPQNQISVFDYWITQKMRKITASTLILIVEPPIK